MRTIVQCCPMLRPALLAGSVMVGGSAGLRFDVVGILLVLGLRGICMQHCTAFL